MNFPLICTHQKIYGLGFLLLKILPLYTKNNHTAAIQKISKIIFTQAVEKVFLCFNTDKKEEKERFLMMGALKKYRNEPVSVSVAELVPQVHFLRAIGGEISFDFIKAKLHSYYCENNGHPPIHPIVLFKMMFIEYFYGIRSGR